MRFPNKVAGDNYRFIIPSDMPVKIIHLGHEKSTNSKNKMAIMQQLPSLSELDVQSETDQVCSLLSTLRQDLVTALPLHSVPLTCLYVEKAFNWHCRMIWLCNT